MTTRHVTSYHLSLWQEKDKQVKFQQISSEPSKSVILTAPDKSGRCFQSKPCDGLRKEDPSRGGVRLTWWNVWGMLRKLFREIGSWSSICLCVYISLLVWKLLVGCGAIGGSKPTKYIKISSGNIWQPSKKPKKRSTFAFFMVAVHEATVSGRHLLWKIVRPSCFRASCVE